MRKWSSHRFSSIEVNNMADKKQPMDKAALVVAIVALVASLGIPMSENVLTNELGDYYICRATEQIQEFKGGISGTGLTGYPYTDSRAGYSRCKAADGTNSEYVSLADYAAEVGLDPYELLASQEPKTPATVSSGQTGAKEVCNFNGCTPI